MKLVQALFLLKIILIVGAVPIPTKENRLDEDDLRDKRSSYAIPYISPCGSSLPSIVPPSYHVNPPPVQQYRPQAYYNYNYPRYRAIDLNEMEMLNTDMNRIAQNAPIGIAQNTPIGMEGMSSPSKPDLTILNSSPSYHQVASQMPAVGVFPYVNPGPMNVPLLFTCTPSIAQGQVVQPQPHYHTGYRADGFRDTDLEYFYEPQENESAQPEYSVPQKSDKVAEKPQ